MKWTLTSPDGLGDFLFRLPWLLEMEKEGWHLSLLARPPTLELARLVGLEGAFIPLSQSPYSKAARRRRDPFKAERLHASTAELVFFGPSQPTFLEEELATKLAGTRLAGFVLDEPFWPGEGIVDPKELSKAYVIKVPVSHSDREPVRNARAASVLLGRQVEPAPFRFPTTVAEAWEQKAPAGKYIVTCPGYRDGDYFRGMGTDKWAAELKAIEQDHRFVFTGSSAEAKSNAAIRAGLARPHDHTDLTGRLETLEELLIILAGADAYVGKDSGTMHLAASLGKPVVAVFGGGHWSRFLPVGIRAVVLTVEVPCRGCDWRCHLPKPVCASSLPMGAVAQAWDLLPSLAAEEIRVIEYAPDTETRSLLADNPGIGHPERTHSERRERLRRERERALQPALVRLWDQAAARLRV